MFRLKLIEYTVDNPKSFRSFSVSESTYIVLLMFPFNADKIFAKQMKKDVYEKIVYFNFEKCSFVQNYVKNGKKNKKYILKND